MEKQRQQLIDIFLDWNSKINLSSIRDAEGVYTKHILDSLELNKIIKLGNQDILDIGTGGGFPILPLAMTHPKANFTGVETRNKKVNAVNDMIRQLNLSNAKIIWSRIEDYKGSYDIITARAWAYIDVIFDLSLKFLKPGGKYCLYKMFSEQEDADIHRLCKLNGLKVEKIHKYNLYDGDITRVIYILRKIK